MGEENTLIAIEQLKYFSRPWQAFNLKFFNNKNKTEQTIVLKINKRYFMLSNLKERLLICNVFVCLTAVFVLLKKCLSGWDKLIVRIWQKYLKP